MTDIVERLRKENSFPPYYGVPKIQAEAADEIERLRAALKAITEVPADWGNEVYEMLEIAHAALGTDDVAMEQFLAMPPAHWSETK